MYPSYKSTSHQLHTALLLLILSIFIACGANRRLYINKENGKVSHGILNDSAYYAIKQFCQLHSLKDIKDTIIIKYDFNHEDCWSTLDMREESHIRKIIENYNTNINNAVAGRSFLSVFQLREPGKAINKYKKWNTELLVDSTGLVGNILFYQKVRCGSSAIILPDKKFILIRSDSHLEALQYNSEMIKALLDIKNQ